MAAQTPALVEKLREQLKGDANPSWYELLHIYLLSGHFVSTIDSLVEGSLESYQPERFTPPLKQLFRPFQLCSPEQLKVVILIPSPWPLLNQADGLALSSKNQREKGVSIPAELGALLEAVQHEFAQPEKGSPQLERWAAQGVLLLNQSLTIGLDKGELSQRKHTQYWQAFFNAVLEVVREQHPTAPILYYSSCAKLADDDPSYDHAYLCENKSPGEFAALLTLINNDLISQGKSPIIW